mmetsp:Transcript_342/g.350  ORF Transcript_342/g.350 Transcript_342/m.350 type:complete len:89 (+) Transcript_342:1253-1519(+)
MFSSILLMSRFTCWSNVSHFMTLCTSLIFEVALIRGVICTKASPTFLVTWEFLVVRVRVLVAFLSHMHSWYRMQVVLFVDQLFVLELS